MAKQKVLAHENITRCKEQGYRDGLRGYDYTSPIPYSGFCRYVYLTAYKIGRIEHKLLKGASKFMIFYHGGPFSRHKTKSGVDVLHAGYLILVPRSLISQIPSFLP